MIQKLDERVKLNNGTEIPGLGFGVFKVSAEETKEAVKQAIINGYRLIDTAQIYGNEEDTGCGIKEGMEAAGLKREDIFVPSKVWNDYLNYDETIKAYEDSLKKLGLDYLDLYLIHWPGKDAFEESWKALTDLYKDGKIRAVGVSNFQQYHLEKLLSVSDVVPVINQIEIHPKLTQEPLRKFCAGQGIAVQAWSPLMQGQILKHPLIEEIAARHQKSAAQVVLRWDIQQEILLVVKSVKPERMRSNADVFDFSLTDEEMEQISALNENLRVGPGPDTFNFRR